MMKGTFAAIQFCLFHAAVFFWCVVVPVSAAELETITDVVLVESVVNDGDSFKVKAGGKELHLRLYYVDAMETDVSSKRTLEQRDRFGLERRQVVVKFGIRAAEYVKQVLSKPFTIHTGYVKVFDGPRVYAFVETHDGCDLAHLLVERGLAAIVGAKHVSPDGASIESVIKELTDLRDSAIKESAGIWMHVPPAHVVVILETCALNPVDVNSATKEQLLSIPGVGPVLAEKIIEGRTYENIEELLSISGIGSKNFAKMAPCVTIGSMADHRQRDNAEKPEARSDDAIR